MALVWAAMRSAKESLLGSAFLPSRNNRVLRRSRRRRSARSSAAASQLRSGLAIATISKIMHHAIRPMPPTITAKAMANPLFRMTPFWTAQQKSNASRQRTHPKLKLYRTNRSQFRWKWLRFGRYSFSLGCVLCLLALLFCWAVQKGVILNKGLAIGLAVIVGGLGLIAWCIILLIVAIASPDCNWLAAALERADRRFLDRLNTLLFLEGKKAEPNSDSFALRIAAQTRAIFGPKAPPRPFSYVRSLAIVNAFGILFSGTMLVYPLYP